MKIVKSSLKFPAVTLTLAVMIFLAGGFSLLKMPRREDPKITIRAGLVMARYPGATAEQVEAQVTRKIEERLFRFAEVKKRRTFSTSRDGVVIIQVELEDWVTDTDKFWTKLRDDLNDLRQRELPDEVAGIGVDADFGDTVAQLIAISGDRYGYRELKDYALRIEEALRTIPATSKIKRYGEQREQIEVATSLQRMAQYRVMPSQIVTALRQQNLVEAAGNFETERGEVPIQTTGLFREEEQVRRVMVDVSPTTGHPVYLGDFTDVHRRYADPSYLVRVNGKPAVMLSVEMQDGLNIVEFGEAVDAKLEEVRRSFPPDLAVTIVADQPRVVDERVSHFNREFLIAIMAVILVTMLLLPWRVATIAAVAIPVTIAMTFFALDTIGIELHQVSIAALIIVLGMVVDDAIVIADNYVELLDHGLPRSEAAWRSASDLAAPVLAATLTIIASFLPLAWLSGTTGEFIRALPITVAVSLFCSYLVAMVLTPLLGLFFIKTGLRAHATKTTYTPAITANTWWVRIKRFKPLDMMERAYDWAVRLAMPRKKLTLALGAVSFFVGIGLLGFVGDRFFPSAERDQFVVDVWLPEGSRLGATDSAMRRIERVLLQTHDVKIVATNVGSGAPRFYYNVTPESPTASYGQFIVNTTSPEITPPLVAELRRTLPAVAPEALVMVKELQQGGGYTAPIEVRISGPDIPELKQIAAKVQGIFETIPGSTYMRTDFREDTYRLAAKVDQEAASRVGVTNTTIARFLAAGFEGAPVSTFWEGSRAVDIVFRLGESDRQQFDDVANAYITSETSGARVPLSQVATLSPVWEPSRIVRRNGMRTITLKVDADEGYLASEILASARATIDTLTLPEGVAVEYGGEYENQNDTQAEMMIALGISLLLIFLILLLQFRSLRMPLVVMVSIPLSVVGAVLGLVITNNPFSFTAFLGLIGLMGLVVRNAIILVDYMNEQIAHGVGVEQAAIDAGRRRLRPIFLTTMAAAAGVLPMILSGSSMWSPLASVLAMGLITSMVFTVLVVPVLYVVTAPKSDKREVVSTSLTAEHIARSSEPAAAGMSAIGLLLAAGLALGIPVERATAQEIGARLTLDEAVSMALANNSSVRIARSRVEEAEQRRKSAGRAYLPTLNATFQAQKSNGSQTIVFPAGSLGEISEGPLPAEDIRIEQGGQSVKYGTLTLAQPLTQVVKIRAARNAAVADERALQAEAKDAELEVALGVEKLYYGLLVAQQRRRASELKLAVAEEALQHRVRSVSSGTKLEVAAIEGRTIALDARQSMLSAEDEIADLSAKLSEALGATVQPTTELIVPPRAEQLDTAVLTQLVQQAVTTNPDVESASQTLRKAQSGLDAERANYIPDVSLFGQQIYQDAVAFLPKNSFVFGIKAEWNVFDFGRREADVAERRAARRTAEENLTRVKRQLTSEVEQAKRKVQRTSRQVALATELLALRKEAARITSDRVSLGVVLITEQRDAEASVASAEADWLAAEVGHRLAMAELKRLVGTSTR